MTTQMTQKLAKLISGLDKLKKSLKNPFHKNNYADINQILAQVKPQAEKLGLTILQPIVRDQVVTVIMDNESGETFPPFETTEAMTGLSINKSNPQERGSEITYYRRYSIQSLLALEAEDDDGNQTDKKFRQAQAAASKSQNYHNFKNTNNEIGF